MQNDTLNKPDTDACVSTRHVSSAAQINVCIDDASTAENTIPHAIALARSLKAQVTLVHVLESSGEPQKPADPVEWGIRRHEARSSVARLANDYALDNTTVSTQVLEGCCAQQVVGCIKDVHQDITAFCRRDDKQPWHLGSTARKVIESSDGSVLIVPFEVKGHTPVHYERLIVPLDGSARAENAIPIAARIALDHKASLLLVHATADFSLVETGPLETFDIELQKQVNRRNEQVSRAYLEKVKQRLDCSGIRVKIRVLKGPDVRRTLTELVSAKNDDLLVFTSHGSSGHQDVPMGDVASYILSRSPVPALMVRKGKHTDYSHMFSEIATAGQCLQGSSLL